MFLKKSEGGLKEAGRMPALPGLLQYFSIGLASQMHRKKNLLRFKLISSVPKPITQREV